jgi:putative sigma-54 modulation protein
MNTTVSFRHMDSSPALRDYATRKLERVVDKYVHGRVDSTVVMSVEKFRHIAKFTVQIKNLTVKGDSSSEDMYSSVDLALDKIERQLRRHKDRLRSHKAHHASDSGKSFRMSVVTPPGAEDSSYEEEFEEDYQNYPAGEPTEVESTEAAPAPAAEAPAEVVTTPSGDTVAVQRQQDYEAKVFSVQQAALQLDLLEDRQFFVFTNSDTQAINIIHRRADGTFGLIET